MIEKEKDGQTRENQAIVKTETLLKFLKNSISDLEAIENSDIEIEDKHVRKAVKVNLEIFKNRGKETMNLIEKEEKAEESDIMNLPELIRQLKESKKKKLNKEELKDIEETILSEMRQESIEIVEYKNKDDYGHSKRFDMLSDKFQDYNWKTREIDEILDEDKIRDTIRTFFLKKQRREAILELQIAESRSYLQELERSIKC